MRALGHHSVALWFCFVLQLAATLAVAQETKPETPLREREEQVPLAKGMDLPEADVLLRERPFDWLVLKTEDVLVIEPLASRPDLISRLTIKHELAQQTYNRAFKYRPYKEAEIASLRQFYKGDDRTAELDAREAALKQELETLRERMDALRPVNYKLQITLRDGSLDPDYTVELRFVETIIYYEDLVLRRADRLIEQGNVPLAYDLLLLVARRYQESFAPIQSELESDEAELVGRVKALEDERAGLRKSRDELNLPKNRNTAASKLRLNVLEKTIVSIAAEIKELEEELRSVRFKLRFKRPKDFPNPEPVRKDDLLFPSWPRFDEVYQRLVLKDSDQQFEQGRTDEALRLLEDLWRPGIDLTGLSARLGRVVDRRITECGDDVRQARHYLARLTARDPTNPIVEKWRTELMRQAASVLLQAREAAAQRDAPRAVQLVDRAARIWPETAGLRDAHRELTERHQVLQVGVLDLANAKTATAIPTEAEERVRLMTQIKLFEPSGISDQGVRYRSAFFDSWEPTDLGRRVQFRLKLKRSDWESRTLITSADIYAELMARIHPDSPAYDERLAGFVDGVTVQSSAEFSVNFRQLPLRPEAMWQFTVAVGDATRSYNNDVTIGESAELGRERFSLRRSDDTQTAFVRVRSQPDSTRLRRVDEVVETRYESWDRALQGLLRGEISLLPKASLQDLKSLQDDGRFFVVPYVQPRSHFLMFHPRNRALQDAQFRRALLHGIPRERLLRDVVLRGVSGPQARLVTCLCSTNSYGYNRQLPQSDYDAALAAALALTAKKQLGGELPVLKMICPSDPQTRELALAMIAEWKRVGIEVQLLDRFEPDGDWDVCYRTARIVEPLTEIWPLLTMQSSARVDALQTLSEPTRRILLELERTVDWTTATRLLHRLMADLQIEARYIPLWEVDEYLVARKNIVGIPTRLMHAYDDLERWTVQSWYPMETP
ncbi:MAG: hypothetical protein JSS49_01870 [Planctomycetes bacterium]|nr:hypothetical protein [Planctomycetota bacterium]